MDLLLEKSRGFQVHTPCGGGTSLVEDSTKPMWLHLCLHDSHHLLHYKSIPYLHTHELMHRVGE